MVPEPTSPKHFIEAYIRYGQLRQDEYLLPAGQVRELLDACADRKQLPGEDVYEASRAIGESYRERLAEYSAEVRQLATNKPGRLWASAEQRKKAYAALGEKENDPAVLEQIRSQKAVLEAKGMLHPLASCDPRGDPRPAIATSPRLK